MNKNDFSSKPEAIYVRTYSHEEDGKVAMISEGENCGVIVFEKDEHCAKKEIIPALRAACAIKNLLYIEDMLRNNTFGYDTKLKKFSEDNLQFTD